MRRILLTVLAGLFIFGALGLAQEIGTRDHPITWLLPPSTFPEDALKIATQIAKDLSALTGLYIKPVVTSDYAALIEALVTAKGDTMACPTTNQYVQITKRNPKVHARLAAVRYGYSYYYTSVYYLRDSGIKSVDDLNGKTWIYPDPASTSGYVLPKLFFDKHGIKPGKTVEAGSHPNSVIALLRGQGDFATGYGSPPLPPSALKPFLDSIKWHWSYGMDPEMWLWDSKKNQLVPEPLRGECRDVRWAVARKHPELGSIWDLVQKIGILTTIGPVPNDSLAFCEGFPKAIEDKIVKAVEQHIRTPEGKALWGDSRFYEWNDVQEIDDSFYDAYRELLGLPIPPRG